MIINDNEAAQAQVEVAPVKKKNGVLKRYEGVICLLVVFGLFYYLGRDGYGQYAQHTDAYCPRPASEHCLLPDGYLRAHRGAGKNLCGVWRGEDIERALRPLMKPLFNLPEWRRLGAVMTFLSDNPAIISLASDKRFSSYFKKFQFISLTNFGTAFGMGLLVMVVHDRTGIFLAAARRLLPERSAVALSRPG